MNVGIILAGGIGSRFKNNKPKQYMKLNGKEVLQYSINAFSQASLIDKYICVVDHDTFLENTIQDKFGLVCVKGGSTRNESIKNALNFIFETYSNVNAVFIHEAARPFITSEVIDKYIRTLSGYDAVITAIEITDSLGKKTGETVERSDYHLIQAPECFLFDTLYRDFKAESDITSTSHQLSAGSKVKYLYDFSGNIKITYPEDLFLAEQMLKYKFYRNNLASENDINILSGKTALVLGASGGLGESIVNVFKELGVKVLSPNSKLIDLGNFTKEELNDFCGNNIPDIIVNSSAFSVDDSSGLLDNFDKTFSVNLKANLILAEFASDIQKRVNLVLISSSSSTRGRKNLTLYSASKAALNSIVESLSDKMYTNNVYMNVLIPEKINTPLIQKLHKIDIDNQELLEVEDVVSAIVNYSFSDSYGELVHIRKGL